MKVIFKAIAIAALAAAAVSCATGRAASEGARAIRDVDTRIEILYDNYPELYAYYAEGLMHIQSMVEIENPDGTRDYELRYKLKNRNIRNESERMYIVKDRFPNLYNDVRKGMAKVTGLYAFVDKDGKIQYHVDYKYLH